MRFPIIVDGHRFYSEADAIDALDSLHDALDSDDLTLSQERKLRARIEELNEALFFPS